TPSHARARAGSLRARARWGSTDTCRSCSSVRLLADPAGVLFQSTSGKTGWSSAAGMVVAPQRGRVPIIRPNENRKPSWSGGGAELLGDGQELLSRLTLDE